MDAGETIGAAEFKTHCLEILDRLSAREVSRVTITKRGRPVAVLVRRTTREMRPADSRFPAWLGGHSAGTDLTAPALDQPFDAAAGRCTDDRDARLGSAGHLCRHLAGERRQAAPAGGRCDRRGRIVRRHPRLARLRLGGGAAGPSARPRSCAAQFLPDPKAWFARVMAGPGIRPAPFTPDIAIDASHLPGDVHGIRPIR